MYICALVGPSGTGKSHRALWVAKEHNIDYIIDDGLLIRATALSQASLQNGRKRVSAPSKPQFLQMTSMRLKFLWHSSKTR